MHKFILSMAAVSCVLMAQEEADSQGENRLSSRWAALTVASVGARYFGDFSNAAGVDSVSQAQYQGLLGGEFRFDPEGKYTLVTLFATGAPFTTSWSNTGVRPYWKQFYFSAKPIKGVELQFGGLGFEPEAFTDIITYSEDGFVTGSRLAIHRPEQLFFDTLSATIGYLGDLDSPDMTGRFRRLAHVNFRQYLASKKIAEHVVASVQYNDQWGIKTVREGVKVTKLDLIAIDSVRAEFYERTNDSPAKGFNFGVGKELSRRVELEAGYTSIDQYFGDLNADAFLHGNRVYLGAEVKLVAGLRAFAMVNRGVHNSYALPNRTHVDVGMVYDLVKGLQKAHVD